MKTKLNNVLTYEQPTKYIVRDENYSDDFSIPVLTAGKSFILGYTNEKEGICEAGKSPVIIFDDFTADSKYVDFDFKVKSSAMKILRPRTQSDSLKYFYYAMQSIEYTPFSHKRVWISDYSNLTIPYPSPEKQQKIVSKLESVDSMIANAERQLALGDELVKSRFVEMFGDPVSNTLGWPQALLCEVTTKIGSGATPKGGQGSYQVEGTSLIRSMNVHDGYFEYKDLAHISDMQAAKLKGVSVEVDDVFINITGASVARSCIVPRDVLPARVNQHVAIIRCCKDQIIPTFANNMFLHNHFKEYLLDIGEAGGATRQAITKQQLENLTVILPPIEMQKEFSLFVEQVDKSKLVIKKSIRELEELKDSLMQKYFLD